MININKDQAQTQVNNFWNYLDELAESNPEEYKKFISQQLKKGFEENSDILKKDKKIEVTPYLCLRYKVIKIKNRKENFEELNIFDKQSIKEVPKIIFSYKFNNDSFSNKIIEDPKVYLNIVHSKDYELPVDENNQPLINPEDDMSWKYIPSQFRYNGTKKSMSGKDVEFYDVLVNTVIIKRLNYDDELKKSILAYLTRKFCVFLESRMELFLKNVKIINKNYKSTKFKPEEFIIDNKKKQDVVPTAKNFHEENKIKIPNISENITNTSTFYNVPKQIPKNENKVLIEEIKDVKKRSINMKKTILSDKEMEVVFDVSEFDIISIDDIDLQVSSTGIRLEVANYNKDVDYVPIDMEFNFEINIDSIDSATFNRESKLLRIILFRH